ncbi:helix-turn-helix transcriptional regulator [Daejeonella lutea]|uniref:Predicted DNA-binding transcriptional regulator YafY, contains an HTH and WYL domains n=1 Tax=Daejeonella lutea TaxID=572036 RepID=A0A1T5DS37_9SPHI|nr:YafY family protein [Daejeonella lutea]SKB74481.1 Predicted DNA-binding transcriptional regulator YafY, contains an HTH and WYL domains [Daejeonella lutea]
MNRIDRISAILIHLQSRKVVKAQDIADRFEISLRTVYRDIRTLEQAGIPLIGEAGMGYSLVDGYRLPPVMFSPEEALAFLTAEKLVAQLTDGPNAVNYSSAMYKIKAVLDEDKRELLQNIGDHIEVFRRPGEAGIQPDLNLMQPVLKSIDQRKVLQIKYHARYNQQKTQRFVEPLGVFYSENSWHLIAFCRMRNDYRDFRFDRIYSMELTQIDFSKEHQTLKEYLARYDVESPENQSLPLVIIRVNKDKAYWLENQKYHQGFISETDENDGIAMSFLCSSLHGFARWFMMFGDHAEVIQPEALKDEVRKLIKVVSERMEK